MKVSNAISFRVSKIVQNKQFVKDILQSIIDRSARVLLIGGAVRDLFLDLPIKDLDFEVYGLTLEQLQEILEQYGPVSLIGKSFGVLRLHGLDIDWSLPRKDSSGRHPVVAYDPYMSYEQAFARRDLTINAMGIDMQTMELIDPYDGQQDLQNKILRAADLDFFAQDPLRLLRVMQFVGRFEMVVDEQLSQLCMSMDMSKVSQERIEQEFAKLFLQSQRPSLGLQWLVSIHKFHEFLPGIVICESLWSQLDFAASQDYATEQEKIVIMWAVIVSFLPVKIDHNFQALHAQTMQPLVQVMKRLTRHDQIIKQVASLIAYAQIISESVTDAQLKWLAVWLAPELSIRLLSKFIMIRYSHEKGFVIAQQAEKLKILDMPEVPLLTGKDFLDIAQGVQLGFLVKKAYQLQIDEGIADKVALKRLTETFRY
ncbi:MAG: CCA tRNA nucleotidyltransferase [Candidatus Dependentiae bacterium]|nr:CCA tRNA nucleotidyltransferase [Candidatus Dependentiae bacterium]